MNETLHTLLLISLGLNAGALIVLARAYYVRRNRKGETTRQYLDRQMSWHRDIDLEVN